MYYIRLTTISLQLVKFVKQKREVLLVRHVYWRVSFNRDIPVDVVCISYKHLIVYTSPILLRLVICYK